jgi:hypothetical protein
LRFLKILKIKCPNDPAILVPGIHPKETKAAYYRDTTIPMFIMAPFTRAKLLYQTRCLSTEEWTKKT